MKRLLSLALLGALAPISAPPAVADPASWCPGQPWRLEWGVNWDRQHCHGTANPQEDDTDLDGDAPPEYGAPPRVAEPDDGAGPGQGNSIHADEGSSSSGHDIGGHQSGGKETGN